MNKIPLSVSSTLTNLSSQQSIAVNAYGNETGKTGSAAPVLIAVESAGTVDAETFAAALPIKGGQGTTAQARLIVNAFASVLSDLVAEYGAITVNTPCGRVDTFVSGSLEYATDAVDPDVNQAFLGIVPSADVMREFAKIESYVPTAACPASLKRVRDVETGKSVIRGTNPFYAQGIGLTYGGTGESVKLLNPLTRAVICTVAVDALTKSEAQLKCTLPNTAAIPAGTYILQVNTLGGSVSTIWPLELKVELAEPVVPPPAFTSATSEGCETGTVTPNAQVTVVGTNLKGVKSTDKVKVKFPLMEGEASVEGTNVVVAADGNSLTFNLGDQPAGAVAGNGAVVLTDAAGTQITSVTVSVEVD